MHMSRAPATSGGVVWCLLSHSLFLYSLATPRPASAFCPQMLHCMESGCFLGQEILHRRSVRNDTQQHIHRPARYRKDTPARLSFQAHSAPLDYKFDSWFTTMYVTFHGSLDRLQSTGCKLFSVSFTKDSAGNYVLWLRQTAGMDTHRSGRILMAQIVVRLSASGPSRL